MPSDMLDCQSHRTLELEDCAHILDEKYLADYNSLCLSHWGEESSTIWRLWKIAELSAVSRPWLTINSFLLIAHHL